MVGSSKRFGCIIIRCDWGPSLFVQLVKLIENWIVIHRCKVLLESTDIFKVSTIALSAVFADQLQFWWVLYYLAVASIVAVREACFCRFIFDVVKSIVSWNLFILFLLCFNITLIPFFLIYSLEWIWRKHFESVCFSGWETSNNYVSIRKS